MKCEVKECAIKFVCQNDSPRKQRGILLQIFRLSFSLSLEFLLLFCWVVGSIDVTSPSCQVEEQYKISIPDEFVDLLLWSPSIFSGK